MKLSADVLMLRPGILRGARLLVTGGGSGLGRIIAEACACLGARVFICGRRGGVLDEAAAQINDSHGSGRVSAFVCDIKSPEAIDSMLTAIWTEGGALTGLVNNAAANFVARAEDVSARGFDAIADTVLRGTFVLTTGCGRRWIAAKQPGAVVSILTTWIWNGGPYASPAAMSKAGLHAMTQSLAVEWAARGIRLNAVCPGAFPTEGMSARLLTREQGLDAQSANPMRRNGKPEELANIVTFLLAPGSEFISGQTIAVDGAGYQATGANFAGLAQWSDADWKAAREKIRATDALDKTKRTAMTEGHSTS